nr:polysaccharide biosynthesis C-terminal domain-containing protein [Clostridia bacterium]
MKRIDMTKGSPFKDVFLFAIPIALGYMFQNLYALGDTLIVSLSRGSVVATGVNITGSLSFFIIGFAQGLSAGFGIVLSQFVGAKNKESMRNSVATSLVLGCGISAVFSIVMVVFATPVLRLLGTDPQYFDYSAAYVRTIFAGLVFTTLYNLSDQFLRAMGDGKSPLIILLLSSTLNLLLDSLMFIAPVGVEWAAWATVISQAISALVGFIILFKKFPETVPKKPDFKFTGKFAWQHLHAGLPMALQFMVTASGCMIVQKGFNDLPGDYYEMAQSTASKIDNIFGSLVSGAGTAVATYMGQNYGAKNAERIKKGFFSALLVGLIFSAFATMGGLLLSVPFAKILLPADSIPCEPDVVYDSVRIYSSLQAVLYFVLFVLIMARGAVQSLNHSSLTVLGGATEFVARFLIIETVAKNGFVYACLANPLAWFAGAVFFVVAFIIAFKTEKRKENIV